MIEKYFRTGIRFKWTKPRDAIGPLDGTIIDSAQTATPLIYDGLDGQLKDPHLMQVNVSTLGLTMRMPIQYAWLDYAPGRTAGADRPLRRPHGLYERLHHCLLVVKGRPFRGARRHDRRATRCKPPAEANVRLRHVAGCERLQSARRLAGRPDQVAGPAGQAMLRSRTFLAW